MNLLNLAPDIQEAVEAAKKEGKKVV